jgi:hypothetical protein
VLGIMKKRIVVGIWLVIEYKVIMRSVAKVVGN